MSVPQGKETQGTQSRHKVVAVVGALVAIVGLMSFGGGVGASTPSQPQLQAGPACEEGNSIVRYEVTNPSSVDHTMTMTIGGETVIESKKVKAGETAKGTVDWPAGVARGTDVDTVVSWTDAGGSATVTHRGDMCSNPPVDKPSRGPSMTVGFVCTTMGPAISFELTNNDDQAHQMNVAVSSAVSQAAPETIVWPADGTTVLVQPGETVRQSGILLKGFEPGTQVRVRGWWRGGDNTLHNRVIGTVGECEVSESTTTNAVEETTTTVPEETTTTVVEETTTTAVEETTTTVPEETTTTVPEETTTTVVEETTTTAVEETTTTVPEETTTTGVEETTTTVVQTSTTVPVSAPVVRGRTQTPQILGLAVTGRNVGSLVLTGGGLAAAGIALMSLARSRK